MLSGNVSVQIVCKIVRMYALLQQRKNKFDQRKNV